jgi:hypothetical protein
MEKTISFPGGVLLRARDMLGPDEDAADVTGRFAVEQLTALLADTPILSFSLRHRLPAPTFQKHRWCLFI